jgi:hypothetical protein
VQRGVGVAGGRRVGAGRDELLHEGGIDRVRPAFAQAEHEVHGRALVERQPFLDVEHE